MKTNNNCYIAGLFDGEGHCSCNRITITNTDLSLIKTVSGYLHDINIENTIATRKQKAKKYYKTAYDIRIYGRRNIDNFYTYIPFQIREKRIAMLKIIVNTKSVINKEEFKQIKKDVLLGMSYREASKKYNHPFTTIYNYLHKISRPNN